jgi:DNA sulfur modification protein DndD
MLMHRLILENFGLFRGRTEIDLVPRTRHKRRLPVILIGGTNGAGKTTVLDAIRLCLYGPLALGERVSQEQYHAYLRSSIHRDRGTLSQCDSASVTLEFEFGLAGVLHRFQVERAWECNGRGTVTSLKVTRDGASIDQLEQSHADEFLRDLIPYGVAQLFFFDGEKIQQMAQASDDDATLAEAIKGLLGLDVLDRLHNDLTIYSGRLRSADASKTLRKELRDIESKLERLQKERPKFTRALDRSKSQADRLRQDIARVKQRLSREGASFATNREELEIEQGQLTQTIEKTEDQLRELCGGLFPFTLATSLCADLRAQLEGEKAIQDWQAYDRFLRSQIAEVKGGLGSALFGNKAAKSLDQRTRDAVIDRVSRLLDSLARKPDNLPSVSLVHQLSDEGHKRLLAAIHPVLEEVPGKLSTFEVELEDQARRLLRVRTALEKIPRDDVLAPLLKQLNDLHRQLGTAESEDKRNQEALNSLEHEIAVQKRLQQKLGDKIGTSKKDAQRRRMATTVQAVLKDYSAALTEQKIGELSGAVMECFGQLWRKGDVLHGIQIDPATCCVMLLDKHDQVIPKERLSAGEKQIYAISMLWALARVSGRVLPMVIDTPLARLDSKHRHHLVTRYFPQVSHQVVILSTDTEIDQTYFQELGPSISHAYHLRFDEEEGRSAVEEGYFWGRRQLEVAL